MKKSNTLVYAAIVISISCFFQNCSPGDFSGIQKTTSSTSTSLGVSDPSLANSKSPVQLLASGNVLTTSSGKVLNFVNSQGLSLGTASITNTQSTFVVSLYNAPSGRKASVKVYVDTAGNFMKVVADSAQPYMCHEPNADICAQYPNATSGQMESNCQSPIFYTGALIGSINGLTTAASDKCASTQPNSSISNAPATASTVAAVASSSQLCSISYSGGGAMITPNISLATCQAACTNNQNLNPSEKLTCLYNNQIISSVSQSSTSSCGGTLNSGAVVNTVLDTTGQSNFANLQCGQANSTALQCRSCSAKWAYPRGSYIGASIQCVCN